MFAPTAIRAEMARRRVTIAELSARSGLAASTISDMLSESGNPRVRNLEKVARALEVSESLFFEPELRDSVKRLA